MPGCCLCSHDMKSRLCPPSGPCACAFFVACLPRRPLGACKDSEEARSRKQNYKKLSTLLDLCVSSLRRGHANLLCIVPILTDDPRRESEIQMSSATKVLFCCLSALTPLRKDDTHKSRSVLHLFANLVASNCLHGIKFTNACCTKHLSHR